MTSPRPIALIGLSSSEQTLLEGALFQPGKGQIPGLYQVRDVAQARVVIADGDDAAVVQALRARRLSAQVVLVGATDMGTGWPLVQRPLRLNALLDVLRRLGPSPVDAFAMTQPFVRSQDGALRPPPVEPATPADMLVHQAIAFEVTRPYIGESDDNYRQARPLDLELSTASPAHYWESEVAEWEARQKKLQQGPVHEDVPAPSGAAGVASAAPAPASSNDLFAGAWTMPTAEESKNLDYVLIVSTPGPAATGLLKILQFAGYPTDLAPDREAAFDYLAQRPYRFVFLVEVTLDGDVFELCRDVRKAPSAAKTPPYIAIVSFRRNMVTRARAWQVGCHTWMTIPLNKSELLEYLERYGTQQ
jgi:CheY-like chemotaxis protein